MKLASYISKGVATFGVVTDEGVITVSGNGRPASLRDALAMGGLDGIRHAIEGAKPDHKLSDIRFLPVITNPEKILCVGINYRSHAAEVGRDLPAKPNLFIRLANTLAAHEGEIIRPRVSTHLDFEGELALIIGRGGRYIKPEAALSHVAGYTCFVDGSIRDYTKFSLSAAKNFPATGPLGPWMVTTDEIPDPEKLTLTTRLNGERMQHSGTDVLIHSIPSIIAFCSEFTSLSPGDVIATGTPEGVGHSRKPPVWMKPGDVLEVEISGIGTLRNRIAEEKV